MSTLSIGLDLGTTQIKALCFKEGQLYGDVTTVQAPKLSVNNDQVVSDVKHYLKRIKTALSQMEIDSNSAKPTLGLCTQRSSFLIWDKNSFEPLTPLISWQDRRAQQWCIQHQSIASELIDKTGLLLSPHYIAPKLSELIANNPNLADGLARGNYLWGTLDCYFLYIESAGKAYQLDATMAARTLMVSINEPLKWSELLLSYFFKQSIPLPKITPSLFDPIETKQFMVKSMLSDQAAAALSMLNDQDEVLVNLGTGGFIIKLSNDLDSKTKNYLYGPAYCDDAWIIYAQEGTINGIASALENCPIDLDYSMHKSPEIFCLPDVNGIGSPHWLATSLLRFSESVSLLSKEQKYMCICEGIIFRVKEIIDDIAQQSVKCILSGGISNIPFITHGIASVLDMPVYRSKQTNASLIGVSRLTAGLNAYHDPELEQITSDDNLSYLKDKYRAWQLWLVEELKRI